jgi:cell wall-associated NlpC family hydrolase
MSVQPVGLETALSRIQQIQSYQQQLLDPSTAGATSAGADPATASSSATAGSGASAAAATSPTSGASFAALLAELEAQDGAAATGTEDDGALTGTDSALTGTDSALTGTATDTTGSGSDLSALTALASANPSLLSALSNAGATATDTAGTAPAAVQAMTTEADALVGQPYVWGGGHSGWGPQSGYDCSGFVSKVLHAAGYLSTPQDTQTLPQAAGIESGPGQYVTIYDRTDAGLGSDHVIIDLDGQFYESGGESGAWGGGGGVAKIGTPSAAYLASFNQVLHPAGL